MLARVDRSLLMLVDVQERLLPQIPEADALVGACETLIRGAGIFEVPVVACEQYPQGLGPTAPVLRTLLDAAEVYPKQAFSAAADPAIQRRLDGDPRAAVVLCGLEAHVCVLQTALDLRTAGRDVFVAADAVGSRAPRNVDLALHRLRAHGVQVVCVEMLLFEWAGSAGTDAFRAMSRLIR